MTRETEPIPPGPRPVCPKCGSDDLKLIVESNSLAINMFCINGHDFLNLRWPRGFAEFFPVAAPSALGMEPAAREIAKVVADNVRNLTHQTIEHFVPLIEQALRRSGAQPEKKEPKPGTPIVERVKDFDWQCANCDFRDDPSIPGKPTICPKCGWNKWEAVAAPSPATAPAQPEPKTVNEMIEATVVGQWMEDIDYIQANLYRNILLETRKALCSLWSRMESYAIAAGAHNGQGWVPLTVTDHKYVAPECDEKGCHYLFLKDLRERGEAHIASWAENSASSPHIATMKNLMAAIFPAPPDGQGATTQGTEGK